MEEMNQQRSKKLTSRIMRRIYLVAAIRAALNPVFLKMLIAAVFFWRSTTFVSYTNVIANAPSFSDVPRNIQFFASAFRHADAGTMLLLMSIAVLFAWVATDVAQRKTHAWF